MPASYRAGMVIIMANIFFHKYKTLSGYDVYKEIEKMMDKQCPLTNYQKKCLREELGDGGINGNLDMPFQAYSWEKNTSDGKNAWWRLTTPLFMLVWLISLPFISIRWVMCGEWGLPLKWKVTSWIIEWWQNIFE